MRAAPEAVIPIPGSYEEMISQIRQTPSGLLTYREFGHFLKTTQRGYGEQIRTALMDLYDWPSDRSYVRNLKKGQDRDRATDLLVDDLHVLDRSALLLLGHRRVAGWLLRPDDHALRRPRGLPDAERVGRRARSPHGRAAPDDPHADGPLRRLLAVRLDRARALVTVSGLDGVAVPRSRADVCRPGRGRSRRRSRCSMQPIWARPPTTGGASRWKRCAARFCSARTCTCRASSTWATRSRSGSGRSDRQKILTIIESKGSGGATQAEILKRAKVSLPLFGEVIDTLKAEGTVVQTQGAKDVVYKRRYEPGARPGART